MQFWLELVDGDEQDRAVIDALKLVLLDYAAIRRAMKGEAVYGSLSCELYPDKRKVEGRAAVTRIVKSSVASA